MNKFAPLITSVGIVMMSFMSWLFGPFDALLVGCAFFAVVDVLTGIVGALSTGSYDSSKFSLKKKAGIAIVVAVLYRCDMMAPVLSNTIPAFANWFAPLRDICLGYFIINDILSIFENLGEWGLDLPKFITSKLARLKEKMDEET